MEKEKTGYIYVLTNKSFHVENWIKIGYAENVKKRVKELSNTSVPLPYDIYCTYEIPRINGEKDPDKFVHDIIMTLNPKLRIADNREFFEIHPAEAFNLLSALARMHSRTDKLVRYDEDGNPIKEKTNFIDGSNTISEEERIFYLERRVKAWENKQVKATMRVKDGKCIVLAGSIICPIEKENEIKSVLSIRRTAKIKNNKLLEDVCFNDPSPAACFVIGCSENGKTRWKDINGISWKDIYNTNISQKNEVLETHLEVENDIIDVVEANRIHWKIKHDAMKKILAMSNIVVSEYFTLASWNVDPKNYYWGDGDLDYIKKNWTIVLLHKEKREITVCEIPAGSYALTEKLAPQPNKLRTRNKKQGVSKKCISLKIGIDLIETQTKADLNQYVIARITY